DTDVRVPLVVVGPGVPAGSITDAMAENIDLAKTFAAIGGTTLADDGHSLLPVLGGTTPAGWRNAILVEHEGPDSRRDAADYQEPGAGNPESYEALRTGTFMYAEYRDGQREYYDLRSDPYELHNLAGSLTPAQRTRLHRELLALRRCHTGAACWAAMHVAPSP
ncbi:MAG: sulfatase/phosphatase domain-containing protein, partial [Solirubrobacteraceae bacterium]